MLNSFILLLQISKFYEKQQTSHNQHICTDDVKQEIRFSEFLETKSQRLLYVEVVVSQELKLFLNPKNLISTKFMNILRTWFSKQFYALLLKKINHLYLLLACSFHITYSFLKKLSVTLFNAKKLGI